jgi:hypothetical protein
MKLIAHRGLINGPDKSLENNPEQILKSLSKGYDCEIDLWYVNSELYLGHDAPQYAIDKDFLKEMGLWIHAKNLAALRFLTDTSYNYFWHQEDDFTLTSHRYIWAYPGKELTMRSIMVMPEREDKTLSNVKNALCYGVCSDFVELLK